MVKLSDMTRRIRREKSARKIKATVVSGGYAELLADLKTRVRAAQMRAVLSVNRELVLLYWHIGREILRCQREQGWGAKVVERLAKDLKAEFPEMVGFSPRNLKYMRAFAEAFPEDAIVQHAAAQIPWFHSCTLLDKVKDPAARLWYARKTLEHGWSRAVLTVQIETRAHERSGKAITNFDRTLPPPQSDLAREALKDPYTFDFLSLSEEAHGPPLPAPLLPPREEREKPATTLSAPRPGSRQKIGCHFAVKRVMNPAIR